MQFKKFKLIWALSNGSCFFTTNNFITNKPTKVLQIDSKNFELMKIEIKKVSHHKIKYISYK